jgi:hypothetical protein
MLERVYESPTPIPESLLCLRLPRLLPLFDIICPASTSGLEGEDDC